LVAGTNTLKVVLRNNFAVSYTARLPLLGSSSQGLRIVTEHWNASRDTLTLQTQGLAGHTYSLAVWDQEDINSIDGAKMTPDGSMEESFPTANDSDTWSNQAVVIHFANRTKESKQRARPRN
jgi:hypothetical protein